MKRRRHLLIFAASGALLLLPASGASAADENGRFEIAGNIDGLYPGIEASMDTELTNPYPFPLDVVTLEVTVKAAGPACPASAIAVDTPEGLIHLAASTETVVPLRVTMDLAAPESCQAAIWPIDFVVTAAAVPEDDGGDDGDDRRRDQAIGLPFTGAPLVALTAMAVLGGGIGIALLRTRHRTRREP